MKHVNVIAAPLADPGLKGKARVAKEGVRRRYITEALAELVPLTPYYARKIHVGELLVLQQPEAKPESPSRKIGRFVQPIPEEVSDKIHDFEPYDGAHDKEPLI